MCGKGGGGREGRVEGRASCCQGSFCKKVTCKGAYCRHEGMKVKHGSDRVVNGVRIQQPSRNK